MTCLHWHLYSQNQTMSEINHEKISPHQRIEPTSSGLLIWWSSYWAICTGHTILWQNTCILKITTKKKSLHVRLSNPRFCQAVSAEQDMPYLFLALYLKRRFFLKVFPLEVLWLNGRHFGLRCCGEGDRFSVPSVSLLTGSNAVSKMDLKYSNILIL